jgi:hypothetical protein
LWPDRAEYDGIAGDVGHQLSRDHDKSTQDVGDETTTSPADHASPHRAGT